MGLVSGKKLSTRIIKYNWKPASLQKIWTNNLNAKKSRENSHSQNSYQNRFLNFFIKSYKKNTLNYFLVFEIQRN